ncbi:hypothetical protein [Roseibium sp.]|uniref:hypothetical protein n=1 Tax=Roseibium sp. TaxID=1936156 RepID=UPI003267DF88
MAERTCTFPEIRIHLAFSLDDSANFAEFSPYSVDFDSGLLWIKVSAARFCLREGPRDALRKAAPMTNRDREA